MNHGQIRVDREESVPAIDAIVFCLAGLAIGFVDRGEAAARRIALKLFAFLGPDEFRGLSAGFLRLNSVARLFHEA